MYQMTWDALSRVFFPGCGTLRRQISLLAPRVLASKRKAWRQLHRLDADSTVALASTPLPTFRHREWMGIVSIRRQRNAKLPMPLT